MSETLRFFKDYEAIIYFVLGVGGIVYFWRFWGAWQDVRGAIYGLERETAQLRLNQTAVVLFLLVMMAVAVFTVVTFITPLLPVAEMVATPTIDLLGESSPNLTAQAGESGEGNGFATATPLPTVAVTDEGCVPGSVEITSPEPGETIRGVVVVTGSADIPNFGFYKFEFARAEQELWLSVVVERSPKVDNTLVEWDTSRLPVGEYVLQLIVTDNEGEGMPPCRVPVRIAPPEE